MNARGLLGLLFHADKALDLVATAHRIGLLDRLDAGPVTLAALASATAVRPLRLYKFLDGLESLGLVRRLQRSDDLLAAEYVASEPLGPAFAAVLAEGSIERDRDRYPWRELYCRLDRVLEGKLDTRFAWPPRTAEEVAEFERSMALGCPPIIEALREAQACVFGGAERWLDVGGGDGTVAAGVLATLPRLRAEVFNLAAVASLVRDRAVASGPEVEARLGFVAGDFLAEPLPTGYQVLSFVRVLHDWPPDVARALLAKAKQALPLGGRIVICEEFRTADRLAAQFFWTYFLIGADPCVSRLRETAWYTDALAALGFVEIQVIPGAFDLIVAQR